MNDDPDLAAVLTDIDSLCASQERMRLHFDAERIRLVERRAERAREAEAENRAATQEWLPDDRAYFISELRRSAFLALRVMAVALLFWAGDALARHIDGVLCR